MVSKIALLTFFCVRHVASAKNMFCIPTLKVTALTEKVLQVQHVQSIYLESFSSKKIKKSLLLWYFAN